LLLFIFLTEELLNIKVDVIFLVLLLDLLELTLEFVSLLTATLSEGISTEGLKYFGDKSP
jgi:hypothetical protein